MSEAASARIQGLKPGDILDDLATHINEPPLNVLRHAIRELPDAIRIPILIIDFDIELNMNGILGFLENSTGRFLAETIAAFEAIGATRTAATLRRIDAIMLEHGVTTADLHADLSRLSLFQVTTFVASHGESASAMADVIGRESENLYLYSENREPIVMLLESYVDRHRESMIEALMERGL
jgi:hypothetical protein